MISLVVLLLAALSLNTYAGTLTIYSTPYTYHSDIVNYAQTDQFVIGKTNHKKAAKPIISRGSPPLPTAVHRFSTNIYSLNAMIKYLVLKRVASMEGRSRTPVRHRPAVVNKSLVVRQIVNGYQLNGYSQSSIHNSKFLILTLHYPINVYTLTLKQKAVLLSKLKPFKDKKLYIEGYTDCIGTKKYNDRLARERAKAVVVFLKKHGYKAVELPSFGKYHTLKTAEESRRVEIYVEK